MRSLVKADGQGPVAVAASSLKTDSASDPQPQDLFPFDFCLLFSGVQAGAGVEAAPGPLAREA